MKNKLVNTLLMSASLLFALFIMEMAARVYWNDYRVVNFLDDYFTLDVTEHPIEYDARLGWVNKPGIAIQQKRGNSITIQDDGIRSNGAPAKTEASGQVAPILAVGDSFAYGYDVSDDETWPAILESLLGRRVINGGVPAYGLDQIFMRAQALIDILNPAVLIFSFIPEDIMRAQLAVKAGISKPYYAIEGGELVLENVPVPLPSLHDHGEQGMRSMLGYSLLLHKVFMRPGFVNWWVRGDTWLDQPNSSRGDEVACRIFRELEDIGRSANMEIIILVQYGKKPPPGHLRMKNAALRCVNEGAIQVLDLRPALLAEKKRAPSKFDSYFAGHMTYEGNRFVAHRIQELLSKSGLPMDAAVKN